MNGAIIELKDRRLLKEIMLKALLEDNSAFISTFNEMNNETDLFWDNYLFNYIIGFHQIIAYKLGDEICGIIGATYNTKEKTKHISTIVWFYVDKKHRGKGIGRTLIQEIIRMINEKEHIKKINLNVSSKQDKALKIYEKNGFKIAGRFINELKNGDEYYDNITMELHL